MSAQDRRAEREVADDYATLIRRTAAPRGPLRKRAKRFAEAFADGLALGTIWHKLFG